MNLPFLKRFNKKVVPLYYLVLVLRDEKAQAVIFQEIEGAVKIIGHKEEHFSTSIDSISQTELLEKLDKAISTAESTLPENLQTQKTIFGVKESWTDNDQIKKEYLAKLKKTSEELGLIPIGFLVISQAIAHLLQKEEGVPVSAILTEINKKSVTVTLLRAGKSIETKSSEIHDSIPFTVDTLLKHFNVPEILPSRIILFNGREDFSQEFISHTWSKSLPFLHLPQITNLPHGFDAKAVLFGAATQMGFAITESAEKSTEITEKVEEDKSPVDSVDSSVSSVIAGEGPTESSALYKNFGAADFGFAKDVDVAKMPAPQGKEFQEPGELQLAQFTNEDVLKEETIPEINSEEIYAQAAAPKKLGNNILASAKNISVTILSSIFTAGKKIKFRKPFSFAPKGKFALVVPAILILAIAIIASYFLFIKATITVTVDPKIIEQDQSVTFSTTGTTDSVNNIIRGEFISVSEEGSVSTAATGKKDVGTTAKGTVTIFNSSSEAVSIPSGSKIVSSNNLEFTLDNSVNLASASSSVDPTTLVRTTKPATTNVNVTANQLGKESNLPPGIKFAVGNFNDADLIAKNDNPFSGGTKKEVTIASKNDSDKLKENLIKQLENQAMEDLQKQLGVDSILLPTFITKSLGKESLNVKIGEETNQLTLTGTVDYQGLSYDKNDLVAFSKSLLSQDIPSDQEIDFNNIKTSVLDIKNNNDEEVNAKLNIKALLLPKVDENNLAKDFKGKSFKFVQDLLYKLPQVANVEIKFSPNLPFLPKGLPIREKNINISIKLNE